MPSTNISMLQTVANGLGELKEDMVFVSGSVAELYAADPAQSAILMKLLLVLNYFIPSGSK